MRTAGAPGLRAAACQAGARGRTGRPSPRGPHGPCFRSCGLGACGCSELSRLPLPGAGPGGWASVFTERPPQVACEECAELAFASGWVPSQGRAPGHPAHCLPEQRGCVSPAPDKCPATPFAPSTQSAPRTGAAGLAWGVRVCFARPREEGPARLRTGLRPPPDVGTAAVGFSRP